MSNENLSQSFILIHHDQSLKEANSELKVRRGSPDWILLVQLEDSSIVGAPFSAISLWIRDRQSLNIELPDLIEHASSPLTPIEVLDQFECDLQLVNQMAEANQYGLVAIQAFGDIVSIFLQKGIKPAGRASIPQSRSNASQTIPLASKPNAFTRAKEVYNKWRIGIIIAVIWFTATTIVSFIFPLLQTNLSDLLPSFFPQVMTGEWNLVVAGFTPSGEGSVSSKDARHIGEVYYNHFANEIDNLGSEIGLHVQILGPKATPNISGMKAEDREVKAARLADKMKADMIVYGTIERFGDGYILKPEFYVNTRNFYEASEMVGNHVLGSDIRLFGVGQKLYSQINLNKELSNRSQVLALITKGLGLYLTHQYDDALNMFTKANTDKLWEIDTGREVVYLFLGNAALRANQLELADEAYQYALAINPQYSRGYAGLGSANYLLALPTERGEDFLPDMDRLEQSLEYYEMALEAEHQPVTADIPVKVAFGKGVVYLTQWLSGQETMDLAVENFKLVVEEYEQNNNQRMQEAASEAHAHLGLIARQNQDIETAIHEYNSALNSATNPARRGLYWSILGSLYQNKNELEMVLDGYNNCVVEYTTAIKLTTQVERRAGYWEKIAACQEGLGNKKLAIDALEQALRYSIEGTDEYIEYETELIRLQSILTE